MAVLYIDGNRFSKLEHAASVSSVKLKEWDGQLKKLRQLIVRSLLGWIEENSSGWLVDVKKRDDAGKAKAETQLRFETLLWGGR